jgi:hypothetical protein
MTLDTLISKLWGFKPSTLTPEGLSKFLTDLASLTISGFLFIEYPHEISNDFTIRWMGAVALLLLMLYGFFPQMYRIIYGRHYGRYVEDGGVGR